MNPDPRWHGWATPDQVREMMQEMFIFLRKNDEYSEYVPVIEVKKIIGDVFSASL
jgi:hypothetical protein